MSKIEVELLEQKLESVWGGRDIVLTFGVTTEDDTFLGTVDVTLQVFQDGAVRYEVRDVTKLTALLCREYRVDGDTIQEHFEELL